MIERTLIECTTYDVMELPGGDYSAGLTEGWNEVLLDIYNNTPHEEGYNAILPEGYKLYVGENVWLSDGTTGGLIVGATDGQATLLFYRNGKTSSIYLYALSARGIVIENDNIVKLVKLEQPQPSDHYLNKTGLQYFWNKLKTYFSSLVTINKIKIGNAELPITDKAVTIPNFVYAITRSQYSLQAHNVNGINDNALTISKPSGSDRLKFLAWDKVQQETVFDIDVPNANELGDLSLLTTDDKTSLVNALNEVYEKSGEPFRVKQWGGSWADGITVPVVTKEISNTQIPKIVFTIDAEEGASYQIVGMIAYEIFDEVSGGNRLNVFPICQFTGNGQKELSVRFMCAGTQDKVAKRINAWVLLKHR